MHVPRAHTDGDAIVHFTGSDVLHMGDVYFNGMYPFIDADSGGSIEGVVAACDVGLKLAGEATRIIPGHGPLSNRRELQTYRDMLADVAARMKKLVAEGKTVEQIVAAKVTADYDAKWGNGFIKAEKFSEMLAAGMGAKK